MGSSNLELIFDSVGHFGRYQIFLYFICAFQNISCGIHYLASVFLSVSPQHTCRPPGNVSQVLFQDLSTWQLEDIWTQFSVGREDHILVKLQDGEIWELTSCQRFRRDDQSSLDYEYSGQKSSFPCLDGYIYDRSKWLSTVVTQWDLVCNREWFGRLIQPTFMFGVLLGAVIFGYLSDSAVTNGVIMVIPKDYHFWLVVATMAGKFFIGAAFGLIYLYTAELYPTIVRSLAVGSGSTVGRVGSIVAPLCIYLSSIWIFMPQLLVGTLALVSGVLTFFLPETLRRPLTTTWEETEKESSSGKLLSTTSNTVLENITVENSEDSSLNK